MLKKSGIIKRIHLDRYGRQLGGFDKVSYLLKTYKQDIFDTIHCYKYKPSMFFGGGSWVSYCAYAGPETEVYYIDLCLHKNIFDEPDYQFNFFKNNERIWCHEWLTPYYENIYSRMEKIFNKKQQTFHKANYHRAK